ncbi:MAG: stage II sporulation protein P [Firmicutes bacterium]|nr:stage II sporulation protein P [Bacillota bacterium]
MNKHRYLPAFGVGLLILGISLLAYFTALRQDYPAWSPAGLLGNAVESDHVDGHVYTITDNSNQMLSKMSRTVTVGDELITGDGRRYKVKSVHGFTARAEFTGMDREMLSYADEFDSLSLPAAEQYDWKNKPIAIYHTHSAESYVPTDGTESIPYKGGIFEVGDTLAAELRKKGAKVLHNKTPHEPRDKNAYYRSRRTAADLMKKNPAALIDVHRDGIPDPGYYTKEVAGDNVTQLRLVVGRQNPKMESNMEFAKKAMAFANKTHPGIVKEIFVARGNYNQDLMSSAMLIEVGTHTNSREEAEKGVALFAESIPVLLGVAGNQPGPGGYTTPAGTPSGWRTMAWIVAVVLLGGGLFLLISSGGLDKARERIKKFSGEITGLGAPAKKPGPDERNNRDNR